MKRLLLLSALLGGAVMTAELVAPRRVTPALGGTLATWTAVITVFLAGLALGNAWGGRLADRSDRSPLALLLTLCALGLALGTWLCGPLLDLDLDWAGPEFRTWFLVTLCFGPAALAAGSVTPALGRAALGTSTPPGLALGALCAAGAAGSVGGTLLTGFVLLPLLGVGTILLGTAGVLVLCALLAISLPWQRRALLATPAAGPAARAAPSHAAWLQLAALAGFSVLVVEMLAARAATLLLGASLYTWTSVLAVVLAGLALGNLLGGRLADRHDPRTVLARWLGLASAAVAACLWTPELLRAVAAQRGSSALSSLFAVAVAYLPSSIVLGALGPAVLRAALHDPAQDGRTLGRVHAALTLGAVGGAALTSNLLVPWMGTAPLLLTVALLLAGAAARLRGRADLPWLATLGALLLLALLPLDAARSAGSALGLRPPAHVIAVAESPWFHLRVEPYLRRWAPLQRPDVQLSAAVSSRARVDTERGLLTWDGPMHASEQAALRAWGEAAGEEPAVAALIERVSHEMRLLTLDGFVHGFADLTDPLWLEYEYEILCGALLKALWPQRESVRAFFIGGGAYTFQRRMRALHGEAALLVTSEVDPTVTRLAERYLGLRRDDQHIIVHDDARRVLQRKPPDGQGPYDFIFGDAFLDVAVPWHLATVEFARQVRAQLAPDGVYVVNLIDAYDSGAFLAAFVRTLREVFAHVDVLRPAAHGDSRPSTYLLVARHTLLPVGPLADDRGQRLGVRRYDHAELSALIERTNAQVLTDDYAPVEALLAPVLDRR